MGRRIVDLSQPLGRETAVGAKFPPVSVLSIMRHTDVPEDSYSVAADVVFTPTHAGTHVDALAHFDRRPGAPLIDEMELELFCGDAVCVDVRDAPPEHAVTVAELEAALARDGIDVRAGDILLFCTDHHARHGGSTVSFSGLDAACVDWMAERGVRVFGVEPISPDFVYRYNGLPLTDYPPDAMPVHRACARAGITHYEGLANLAQVVGRRFLFVGAPLRLRPATGSPVRALAILDE